MVVMPASSAMAEEFSHSVAGLVPARRDDVLVRLSELFSSLSTILPDDGVDTFDAIFVSLLPVCGTAARVTLANTVAPLERAPGKSIRHLAFDDSIVVASPVIKLSPLLLDDHLLALATVKSTEHLLALCERNRLASAVTDVILSRANGAIRVALVTNPGAELSPAAQAKLADAALDDGELYDLMVKRPDLAQRLDEATAAEPEAPGRSGPFAAQPAAILTAGLVDHAPVVALDERIGALLRNCAVDAALAMLATAVTAPISALSRAYALDVHGAFLAYAKAVPLSWETTHLFLQRRYEAGQVVPRPQRAELDFRKLLVADARRVVAMLAQHAAKPH
jgi:hypothetical protein